MSRDLQPLTSMLIYSMALYAPSDLNFCITAINLCLFILAFALRRILCCSVLMCMFLQLLILYSYWLCPGAQQVNQNQTKSNQQLI